jgi:transcriptional regulator with XRE-family HTH domain
MHYNDSYRGLKVKKDIHDIVPMPAMRALAALGADISAARRRRRISTSLMAERAFIARTTLARVEKGDPTVSMGIYASVLFVLGMAGRIETLVALETDEIGLALEAERLPLRISRRKKP